MQLVGIYSSSLQALAILSCLHFLILGKVVNIQARCDIWKQQIHHSEKQKKENLANSTICSVISLHPSCMKHSRPPQNYCKQIVFGNIFLGSTLECVVWVIDVAIMAVIKNQILLQMVKVFKGLNPLEFLQTCLTVSCVISSKNRHYSPVSYMVRNKEFGNNLNKVKQLWSQPWDGLEGFIFHLSCVTTATQADRFLKSGHTNAI